MADSVYTRHRTAAISTATTTTVKSGTGTLASITILGGTLGAITVYDNTAASGTTICPAFTPASGAMETLTFNVGFTKGLTIVTAAATVIQVSYQ
jgi:hypothetical protein